MGLLRKNNYTWILQETAVLKKGLGTQSFAFFVIALVLNFFADIHSYFKQIITTAGDGGSTGYVYSYFLGTSVLAGLSFGLNKLMHKYFRFDLSNSSNFVLTWTRRYIYAYMSVVDYILLPWKALFFVQYVVRPTVLVQSARISSVTDVKYLILMAFAALDILYTFSLAFYKVVYCRQYLPNIGAFGSRRISFGIAFIIFRPVIVGVQGLISHNTRMDGYRTVEVVVDSLGSISVWTVILSYSILIVIYGKDRVFTNCKSQTLMREYLVLSAVVNFSKAVHSVDTFRNVMTVLIFWPTCSVLWRVYDRRRLMMINIFDGPKLTQNQLFWIIDSALQTRVPTQRYEHPELEHRILRVGSLSALFALNPVKSHNMIRFCQSGANEVDLAMGRYKFRAQDDLAHVDKTDQSKTSADKDLVDYLITTEESKDFHQENGLERQEVGEKMEFTDRTREYEQKASFYLLYSHMMDLRTSSQDVLLILWYTIQTNFSLAIVTKVLAELTHRAVGFKNQIDLQEGYELFRDKLKDRRSHRTNEEHPVTALDSSKDPASQMKVKDLTRMGRDVKQALKEELKVERVFTHKARVKHLTDLVKDFCTKANHLITWVEASGGDRASNLLKSVVALNNIDNEVNKEYRILDAIGETRLDPSYMYPYYLHLFATNMHRSANFLAKRFKDVLKLCNKADESQIAAISKKNELTTSLNLLVDLSKQRFCTVLDAYGNYKDFLINEATKPNRIDSIRPSQAANQVKSLNHQTINTEQIKTSKKSAIEGAESLIGLSAKDFMVSEGATMHSYLYDPLFNTDLNTSTKILDPLVFFARLPKTNFVTVAKMKIKICIYPAQQLSAMVSLKAQPPLECYYIVLNSNFDVDCYSKNLVDMLPEDYELHDKSLRDIAPSVFERMELWTMDNNPNQLEQHPRLDDPETPLITVVSGANRLRNHHRNFAAYTADMYGPGTPERTVSQQVGSHALRISASTNRHDGYHSTHALRSPQHIDQARSALNFREPVVFNFITSDGRRVFRRRFWVRLRYRKFDHGPSGYWYLRLRRGSEHKSMNLDVVKSIHAHSQKTSDRRPAPPDPASIASTIRMMNTQALVPESIRTLTIDKKPELLRRRSLTLDPIKSHSSKLAPTAKGDIAPHSSPKLTPKESLAWRTPFAGLRPDVVYERESHEETMGSPGGVLQGLNASNFDEKTDFDVKTFVKAMNVQDSKFMKKKVESFKKILKEDTKLSENKIELSRIKFSERKIQREPEKSVQLASSELLSSSIPDVAKQPVVIGPRPQEAPQNDNSIDPTPKFVNNGPEAEIPYPILAAERTKLDLDSIFNEQPVKVTIQPRGTKQESPKRNTRRRSTDSKRSNSLTNISKRLNEVQIKEESSAGDIETHDLRGSDFSIGTEDDHNDIVSKVDSKNVNEVSADRSTLTDMRIHLQANEPHDRHYLADNDSLLSEASVRVNSGSQSFENLTKFRPLSWYSRLLICFFLVVVVVIFIDFLFTQSSMVSLVSENNNITQWLVNFMKFVLYVKKDYISLLQVLAQTLSGSDGTFLYSTTRFDAINARLPAGSPKFMFGLALIPTMLDMLRLYQIMLHQSSMSKDIQQSPTMDNLMHKQKLMVRLPDYESPDTDPVIEASLFTATLAHLPAIMEAIAINARLQKSLNESQLASLNDNMASMLNTSTGMVGSTMETIDRETTRRMLFLFGSLILIVVFCGSAIAGVAYLARKSLLEELARLRVFCSISDSEFQSKKSEIMTVIQSLNTFSSQIFFKNDSIEIGKLRPEYRKRDFGKTMAGSRNHYLAANPKTYIPRKQHSSRGFCFAALPQPVYWMIFILVGFTGIVSISIITCYHSATTQKALINRVFTLMNTTEYVVTAYSDLMVRYLSPDVSGLTLYGEAPWEYVQERYGKMKQLDITTLLDSLQGDSTSPEELIQMMVQLKETNVCNLISKWKSYPEACTLVDKGVASKGVVQGAFRASKEILERLQSTNFRANSTAHSKFMLDDPDFIEFEAALLDFYLPGLFVAFTNLNNAIVNINQGTYKKNSNTLLTVFSILVGLGFITGLAYICSALKHTQEVLFVFRLAPMRTLLTNQRIRPSLLRIYRLPLNYFN